MNLGTHLALLVTVDDHLLLQQIPVSAALDAGQWRIPLIRGSSDPVPPNPTLCGIALNAASGLSNWLEQRGVSTRAVLKCVDLGHQTSPPWHPKTQDLLIIEVQLSARPQALDDETWRWERPEVWLRDWNDNGLLLNPLTQELLASRLNNRRFEWHNVSSEQAISGLNVFPVRSHTLPPATHTNAFLLGDGSADSPAVLVDPSPADDDALDDLVTRLTPRTIDAIFLTHHHPDHHQHATRLAQCWSCPVWCSADTRERIPARFGADYWAGVELRTIDNGDLVTRWKGQAVHAHAVPGHDAGQLALMPEGRQWMIVGDLIQGIGTVVIAEPEGDMTAYFQTLSWVIEQDPAVIIPSHGQAMGSTFRIAETLRHRQLRETQVLALYQSGHSPQSMVETIYAEVDKRLWGLARMNIDCHLKKLADEGRL